MSLLYHSCLRFAYRFLPLMERSTLQNGAACISIFAGGLKKKNKFFPEDLSLRKPEHYTHANLRSQITLFKTLFFKGLGRECPGRLRCIHLCPGLVITPAFYANSLPWWFKTIWRLVYPFAQWWSISPEEIGERVLFLSSNHFPKPLTAENSDAFSPSSVTLAKSGRSCGGVYSVDQAGEVNDAAKEYADMDRDHTMERVWQHTMKVFCAIEVGQKYTGWFDQKPGRHCWT